MYERECKTGELDKGRIAVTFRTCIYSCVYVRVCVCERARVCVYTYGPCRINDVTYYLCIFLSIRKVGTNIASNFLVSTTF